MLLSLLTTKLALVPPLGATGSGGANLDLSSYLVLKDGQKVSEVFKTPADMINLIVSNAFVVGGIFIFILIILAGFKLLSQESKGMEEAKTLIMNAGIGFGLLFGSY
jgi:hypothetical protein